MKRPDLRIVEGGGEGGVVPLPLSADAPPMLDHVPLHEAEQAVLEEAIALKRHFDEMGVDPRDVHPLLIHLFDTVHDLEYSRSKVTP